MRTQRRELLKGLSAFASTLALLATTTASAQELVSSTSTFEEDWSYTGTYSPERWGDLPGYELCATGQRQTPIPLWSTTTLPLDLAPPSFSYFATPLRMVHKGHTVEFEYEPGSTVTVGGATFRLAQFHFHTPSEHTLDLVSYPLEMHLVHVDANGAPALVVGIFIKRGAENATLSTAFANLPQNEGDVSAPSGAFLNAFNLLPGNRTHFEYAGSLTTPPCTEGIRWYVMQTPIEMSDAQIAAFQGVDGVNPSARPLQEVNGRLIEKYLDLL